MTDILILRETVNDDWVTIVEWHCKEGQWVEPGQVLFSIETSKSVLDVHAETAGYLEIVQNQAARVAIGEVAGRLHPQSLSPVGTCDRQTVPAYPTTSASSEAAESTHSTWFSNQAKQIIDHHGLDESMFDGFGLVRAAEVRRVLNRKPPETITNVDEAEDAVAFNPPAPAGPPTSPKGLFADARASAGDRGCGIVRLIFNYIFRNYFLGLLVRIAPRGLLIPIHRLRGVKIGKGCFVDPTAILETAYPEQITIGNDVRVAARSIIMTHIKGPHYLREQNFVPTTIKPVVLEDHCFIGVNATIMPGVRISKGAVVASGAVVNGDVAAHTLVSGNPAQLAKRFSPSGPPPREASL